MTKVAKKEERILKIGEDTLAYRLQRKAVRRINLRVQRDGSIDVSAPDRVALSVIEGFLQSKWSWICEARQRVLKRQGEIWMPADGRQLPIAGILHTVLGVKAQKQGVLREDGRLILQLRHPEDDAERLRVLLRFVRSEAERVLTQRAQEIYPLFYPQPPAFPTLTFRAMKSRWGSCTASKNHITLNTNLLLVPPHLADYVILHEFCHFKHQNHSAAYYRHLSRFCPDYAAARRALRAFPMPKIGASEEK